MNNRSPNISMIAQSLFVWVAQFCQMPNQQQGDCAPPLSEAMTSWSEREWQIAKAVIIVHGMGPLLGYLITQIEIPPQLPPALNAYLHSQFLENQRRIALIAAANDQITSVLQRNNISFVAFKGLTLARQLYPDLGIRPMADIDLYTGQQDQTQLTALLATLDFQPHVITPEGMTLYHRKWSSEGTQELNWQGASVAAPDQSLWYQGESCQLPFALDIHFSMQQGIQEFRYDLEPMFLQALAGSGQLTPEQTLIHLLLHASKHFRCRGARWIQLYDLHLLQKQASINVEQVLTEGIKHQFCPLLLWPLILSRKIFNTQPSWLEQQLRKHTSKRFLWLFDQHSLASLSHCNPKDFGLIYSLLWTQDLGKIRQWLTLSAQTSGSEFKRNNVQLQQAQPMTTRIIERIRRHFSSNVRQQWHIFSQQGLQPREDWDNH